MKSYGIVIVIFLSSFRLQAQRKTEHLEIAWPAEYNWKIVKQSDDSIYQEFMIIPGNETVNSAEILGVLKCQKNARFSSINELVEIYQNGMDSGSVLTLIDKKEKGNNPWAIFKVETPVTRKYPEPESDLYFVIQGEYAVYENYVAIKKPSLSSEFLKKWIKIFKSAKLKIE